jgi:hypothetical protein
MVTMVTMGGDLQPGCLADQLLIGLGQPQISVYRTNNISRRKNIVFGGCGELTPPEI